MPKKTKSAQNSKPSSAAKKLSLPVVEVNMNATRRNPYAGKFPRLEGRGVQEMHPRIVNVSFDVTQEVAAALRALRETGFYGNGVDCASIAEELLRRALLDPEIVTHWKGDEA